MNSYRVWEGATPIELKEIKETYISYLLELSSSDNILEALLFLANIRKENFTSYSTKNYRNEYYDLLTYFCFLFELNGFDELLLRKPRTVNRTFNMVLPKFNQIIHHVESTLERVVDAEYKEVLNEINSQLTYVKTGISFLLKALPPQQTETKTEQEQPTFENNFDNITTVEIYKHFKAGLVDKKYLTEQELIQYLKVAFELKTIPETLFKIKHAPTKLKVMRVFYDYYKNVAAKPHRKQNNYAALLGNYFEGYETENVRSNFSK